MASTTSTKKRREQKRNTPKRWDAYVQEAEVPDFILEVDDDRDNDIHIVCPTADTIIAAKDAHEEDIEEGLRLLCGDAFEQVRALIGPAPWPAMVALFNDINNHFDLGDPTSPN